jgi:hypothetical protein
MRRGHPAQAAHAAEPTEGRLSPDEGAAIVRNMERELHRLRSRWRRWDVRFAWWLGGRLRALARFVERY